MPVPGQRWPRPSVRWLETTVVLHSGMDHLDCQRDMLSQGLPLSCLCLWTWLVTGQQLQLSPIHCVQVLPRLLPCRHSIQYCQIMPACAFVTAAKTSPATRICRRMKATGWSSCAAMLGRMMWSSG